MARPSKRKPLARVKRDTKQSWEVALLGGRKNQPPSAKALDGEDLEIFKSSNENCSVLNYSGGGGGTRMTSVLEGEGGGYPSLYLSCLNIKKEAQVLKGMLCASETEKPQILSQAVHNLQRKKLNLFWYPGTLPLSFVQVLAGFMHIGTAS